MKPRIKRVIVMQGPSGAGKTTAARGIAGRAKATGLRVRIASADDFFAGRAFVPGLTGEANAMCMGTFANALSERVDLIIVDNTATRPNEVEPYLRAARDYDYEARVIRIECDPELAYSRNVHDVSLRTVRAQAARIAAMNVPASWRLIRMLAQSTEAPPSSAPRQETLRT